MKNSKVEIEITIKPEIRPWLAKPTKKEYITGYAHSRFIGLIGLQTQPLDSEIYPEHKESDTIVEDTITHETLHHVCHIVSGEKAYWDLDNLCYPKSKYYKGFGIVFENFYP